MTEIESIRNHLSNAAEHQPEHAAKYNLLSEGGDEEAKAALRPMIQDSLKKIAGCGR